MSTDISPIRGSESAFLVTYTLVLPGVRFAEYAQPFNPACTSRPHAPGRTKHMMLVCLSSVLRPFYSGSTPSAELSHHKEVLLIHLGSNVDPHLPPLGLGHPLQASCSPCGSFLRLQPPRTSHFLS